MTYTDIVVALVLAIPLAGAATELLQRRLRMRGYGDIVREVAAIVRAIDGEVDRDSGDLLIRGAMSSSPVLVRFSHSDQRPGLNIQVPAAGNLSLFCVPKGYESGGRIRLQSSDPRFDAQFRLSSNHPELATLLFCNPETLAEIARLCRSPHSFLLLEQQRLEITELLIPEQHLSQRVLDCIRGMIRIAVASRHMPGAQAEHVPQFSRRRNWFRTAYLVVPVLLLLSLVPVARLQQPAVVPQPPPTLSDIAEQERNQVPDLQNWRLAEPGNFDADAAAWLQRHGQAAKGSIAGAFAGNGYQDSAYILKRIPASPENTARLLIFVNGKLRYDATMRVAIAGRIPKDRIGSIEWRSRGPGQPDGDGIFVIQNYQDAASAIVFFSSGVQLLSGRPRDFHALSSP